MGRTLRGEGGTALEAELPSLSAEQTQHRLLPMEKRKSPVSLSESGPGGYSCQELCPHVFFSQERAEHASSSACHFFCANLLGLLHLLELGSGALAKNVFVFTAPSPLSVKEQKACHAVAGGLVCPPLCNSGQLGRRQPLLLLLLLFLLLLAAFPSLLSPPHRRNTLGSSPCAAETEGWSSCVLSYKA